MSAFLNWFLSEIVPTPHSVVAAGHAATYAALSGRQSSGHNPSSRSDRADLARTIADNDGRATPMVCPCPSCCRSPAVGPILYRLNVSRPIMAKMAKEHVYSNPDWLGGDRLATKLAATREPGDRNASVRFVSGGLDRVDSRAAFLDLARRSNVPILVIYGDETPPKSRAEMEALAELSQVQVKRLAKGKLSVHEEFPDAVANTILPFLS